MVIHMEDSEKLSEECYEGYHDWGTPENLGDNLWRVICRRCGEEWEEYAEVEYWKRKTMTVRGKAYPAVKAWTDIALCSECGIPIFDVPLILSSSEDTTKALIFCWPCANKLGILDLLRDSPVRL